MPVSCISYLHLKHHSTHGNCTFLPVRSDFLRSQINLNPHNQLMQRKEQREREKEKKHNLLWGKVSVADEGKSVFCCFAQSTHQQTNRLTNQLHCELWEFRCKSSQKQPNKSDHSLLFLPALHSSPPPISAPSNSRLRGRHLLLQSKRKGLWWNLMLERRTGEGVA